MDSQDFSWASLNTCVFCKASFPENKHYYTTHGIKLANYVTRNFPKQDLYTGEKIEFKHLEQYYCQDFNNKKNLQEYVKKLQDPKPYLLSLFKRRIEVKSLKYAPTQVELKSLGWPSIKYLDKVFDKEGGYYKVCAWLGLQVRHIKYQLGKHDTIPFTDQTILIDTREQQNFKFYNKSREIQKLEYGDYQLLNNDKYGKCAVERKSLNDFIGSFGKAHERLEAEIIRAKEDGSDLVILVEESLSNCLEFNRLPKISKYIKTSPDYVFHNVRELLAKYDHIQFLFVKNRTEAGEKLPFILLNWSWLKQYDLQYLYDMVLI